MASTPQTVGRTLEQTAEQASPQTSPQMVATALALGWWERSWVVVDRWLPHALLATGTVLSVATPGQPAEVRLGTLALAALAAAWITLWHTRAPAGRFDQPWYGQIYLAGMLAFATLLMARDLVFFVFAIGGFLHSAVLRPRPLVFLGTGTSSFLILWFTWGGLPSSAPDLGGFVLILLIQTFLIGFSLIGGEKMSELSEERRRIVRELQATLAENEGLHAQLVAQAREAGMHDERQRLAHEIHDTLAQGLTGVITQLEAARRDDTDPTARRRHLDNAAALARQGLAEARRSVHAISPEPLDDHSLPAALQDVARRWAALHGVTAQVTTTGEHQPLHPEIEASLLRVMQEALANVAKHAGASQVGVTLSYMGDVVALDVRDDGIGFATNGVAAQGAGNGAPGVGAQGAGTQDVGVGEPRGFGLTVMRQRIDRLAGTFDVESTPGVGTAISATVPALPAG